MIPGVPGDNVAMLGSWRACKSSAGRPEDGFSMAPAAAQRKVHPKPDRTRAHDHKRSLPPEEWSLRRRRPRKNTPEERCNPATRDGIGRVAGGVGEVVWGEECGGGGGGEHPGGGGAGVWLRGKGGWGLGGGKTEYNGETHSKAPRRRQGAGAGIRSARRCRRLKTSGSSRWGRPRIASEVIHRNRQYTSGHACSPRAERMPNGAMRKTRLGTVLLCTG